MSDISDQQHQHQHQHQQHQHSPSVPDLYDPPIPSRQSDSQHYGSSKFDRPNLTLSVQILGKLGGLKTQNSGGMGGDSAPPGGSFSFSSSEDKMQVSHRHSHPCHSSSHLLVLMLTS
jgi:hypothetical protein